MKLKIIRVLFIPLVAILLIGCQAKKPTYYKVVKFGADYSITAKFPISDTLGQKINCYRFTYDKTGRILSVEYYKHGKPAVDNYLSVFKMSVEYFPKREIRTFYGINGNPMQCYSGAFSDVIKFDENNHPKLLLNYNRRGELMLDNNYTAQYLWSTDNKGRIISEKYFKANGEKTRNADLASETKFAYDNNDHMVERGNYGDDGQIFSTRKGIPVFTRFVYDKQGNIVEKSFYNADNLPMRGDDGAAFVKYSFNAFGNVTKEAFFGANELPVKADKYGASKIEYSFNEYGDKTEERYYGLTGALVGRRDFGPAIIKWEYDDSGNMVKESYFDGKNKLMLSRDNLKIAGLNIKYGSNRNKIEESYFDVFGKIAERSDLSIAKMVRVYDNRGNLLEEKTYGMDNKLKDASDYGVGLIKYTYDDYGNVIGIGYFGANGKPKALKGEKYSKIVKKYDKNGNLIKQNYFDVNGKLINKK